MFSFFKRSKSKNDEKQSKKQKKGKKEVATVNELDGQQENSTVMPPNEPSISVGPPCITLNEAIANVEGGGDENSACSSNLVLRSTPESTQIHFPPIHVLQSSSASSISTFEVALAAADDETKEKQFDLNINLTTENNTLQSAASNSQHDTTNDNSSVMAKGKYKRNNKNNNKIKNNSNSSANIKNNIINNKTDCNPNDEKLITTNSNSNENEKNSNSIKLVKFNLIESDEVKIVKENANVQKAKDNEVKVEVNTLVDQNLVDLVCGLNLSENGEDKNKITKSISNAAAAVKDDQQRGQYEDDTEANLIFAVNAMRDSEVEFDRNEADPRNVAVIATVFSPPAAKFNNDFINELLKHAETKNENVLVNSPILKAAYITTSPPPAACYEKSVANAKFYDSGDFANTTTPTATADTDGDGQHKNKSIISSESKVTPSNTSDKRDKGNNKNNNELLNKSYFKYRNEMGQNQSVKPKPNNINNVPKNSNNKSLNPAYGNNNSSDDIFYEARNNEIDFIIDSITTQALDSSDSKGAISSNEDFEVIYGIGSEVPSDSVLDESISFENNTETSQEPNKAQLIDTKSYTICENAFKGNESKAIAVNPADEKEVKFISLRKTSNAGQVATTEIDGKSLTDKSALGKQTAIPAGGDESVTLPDVVESRCIIVLDQQVLDKGKSPLAGNGPVVVDKDKDVKDK